MSDDLYAELGISSTASEAEIKAAKRARSRETHPDAGGDAEEFDRVTKAALVLLDPERREHYDATGETDAGTSDDHKLQGALGLMRQAIEGFIEHGDPERQDIIAKATLGLDESRKERAGGLLQLERRLEKHERNIKRLRYRGAKADVVGNMMREKAAGMRAEIRQCKDAIDAHDLAIELLGDYEWDFDKPADGLHTHREFTVDRSWK